MQNSTIRRHEELCPNLHHRPFSLERGDRVRRTEAEALEMAAVREAKRGPQVVTLHKGTIFKRGVWFIQDADA